MKNLYWWRVRSVRGKVVRRFAWWLRQFRWPGQRMIKSRGRRYRLSAWLLAITDDRRWTLRFQTPTQLRLRRWLGRSEREYELEKRDEDAP